MTLFLKRAWIEKAVLCEQDELLPKKVKAQVTEIKEQNANGEHLAVLTDNQLSITALFTNESAVEFLSNDTYESLTSIAGGFIIIMKYKVIPKLEDERNKEFVVVIERFKLYAGAEGTAAYGEYHKGVIDSTCHSPIAKRLTNLWETEQLLKLCERYSQTIPKQAPNQIDVQDLLNQVHEAHTTNACFFMQSKHAVAEATSPPKSDTSKLDISQQTNSSTCSRPFFPENLMDHTNFEPLMLDSSGNQPSESQPSNSQDNLMDCSLSEPTIHESGNLSMLIGVCENFGSGTGESQGNTMLGLSLREPEMFGDTASSPNNTSEDIMDFIDEYWATKYRQIRL